MLRSVFIALPKKAGATECELPHTISLMSNVTKILFWIVMMRVKNKIRTEIAEGQCGFMKGKISWIAKRTNVEVMEEAGLPRS